MFQSLVGISLNSDTQANYEADDLIAFQSLVGISLNSDDFKQALAVLNPVSIPSRN